MKLSSGIDAQHIANLRRDLGIIILSILVAIFLVQTGAIHHFVALFKGQYVLSSLVAGFFWSSMFTIAPAVAVLGDLSNSYPLWQIALFGAIGSVVCDAIIFRFVKDDVDEDLLYIFNLQPHRRLRHIIKTKVFHWILPLLAGLIIASPLPDELAMAVIGFTKVNKKVFTVITFIFSFFGILLIGYLARSF
ncbi:MAG: hypothetical protein V1846_03810 [Candidatus Komeilibacteria bacterium]